MSEVNNALNQLMMNDFRIIASFGLIGTALGLLSGLVYLGFFRH